MQLSVIIVNYNVKYFLEQCLYSVAKSCRNIETEIFVVDNNSGDGSKQYLENKFPAVHFIWQNENTGFAKANNFALKNVRGKYVLFLNPDTIVPEDCLETCISFLEKNVASGAVGVRMIDGSGSFLKESKRAFPSPFTSLFKLFGLAKLFPTSKIFSRYHLGHLNQFENHEVDVLAGAFIMCRKNILDKIGGFDEQFFMYGEDIDLSYRIQKAGYKNYYLAETTIIHFKGESTKVGSLNYVKMFYRAMSLFVQKHYVGGKAYIYNFFIHLAIFFRAIISAIAAFFKRIAFSSAINKRIGRLLIVGTEKTYSDVCGLIVTSSDKFNIAGRIDPYNESPVSSLGTLSNLNQILLSHKINDVVFCENGLSFKDIIQTIQQLPPDINYMFHATGSGSIVCSNSKNSSGEYLAG